VHKPDPGLSRLAVDDLPVQVLVELSDLARRGLHRSHGVPEVGTWLLVVNKINSGSHKALHKKRGRIAQPKQIPAPMAGERGRHKRRQSTVDRPEGWAPFGKGP